MSTVQCVIIITSKCDNIVITNTYFQKAFLGDFSLLSNDFPGNVSLVS